MIGCIYHDGDCCKDREEVYRDAARYRWLRDNPTWIGYDSDFRPDEVDAVIDAAMLKAPNALAQAAAF